MQRTRITSLLVYLLLLFSCFNLVVLASEPTVSMVLIQDDLRDAITELILQTGVNILVDDTVYGLVTLDLVDVPLETALRMMLMPGGYEYREIDDFYFVGTSDPRSQAFRHLAETETFTLEYLTAAKARELLPETYDRYLRSGRDGNLLTITAPQGIIDRFRHDLQTIDKPVPQILVQALVIEISRSELEEWGSKLLSYVPNAEMTIEASKSWLDHIVYENTVFNFGFFGKVLSSIRALEAEKKAEIKANPRVVVSNGETVDLFSGETHFLVISNTISSNRLEQVNVGVSLKVTPRVVNDETLQIAITPEISHMAGQPLNKSEGFAVRRSAITTNVYAQNEQSLLLAGMTLQQSSDQDGHVPILGKLPLIRWLFSERNKSDEERELLIFVTAEIL